MAHLRNIDPRMGYNGKRGGTTRSNDAIAYYHGAGSAPEGSRDVFVVDVIGGHCGATPGPAWIDQSQYAPGAWYSGH